MFDNIQKQIIIFASVSFVASEFLDFYTEIDYHYDWLMTLLLLTFGLIRGIMKDWKKITSNYPALQSLNNFLSAAVKKKPVHSDDDGSFSAGSRLSISLSETIKSTDDVAADKNTKLKNNNIINKQNNASLAAKHHRKIVKKAGSSKKEKY